MSSPRLRIALVQTQAENAGAQEISRIVARGLERRGYEVRQMFFFRRTAAFDAVENATAICPDRPSSPLAVLGFLRRLRAALRDMRPDAVVTFQHYGNVIAAPMARSVGCRTVVANQVSTLAMISRPVRWADAVLGALGVYSRIVINSIETEAIYRRYARPYRRRLVRIDHGFEDKTAAIPAGDARDSFGLPRGVILAGCASRLSPLKQLDCAVRILAIRPDLHLAIAGQGPERERLDALAATLGVAGRLHLVGELDPSEIGTFLAGLDVFVHPSCSETFGLAPVEAAQAGVPVVCNDLEVLRDVLRAGGEPCALFVDAQDPEALAGAVDRALGEPGLADALRSVGRRLSERYPVDAMVDRYVDLIEALVRGKQPCGSPSTLPPARFDGGRSSSAIG